MKKILSVSVLALLLTSCEYLQKEVERKPANDEAKTKNIHHMSVFVFSKPLINMRF